MAEPTAPPHDIPVPLRADETRLQRRVAELEAELKTLRATVTSGTWTWDSERPEVLTLSAELSDVLGLSGSEPEEGGASRSPIAVAALGRLVNARDFEGLRKRLRRRIKRGGRFKTEVQCIIGGAPRWVSTVGEVIVGERGRRILSGQASFVVGDAVEAHNEHERRARAVRDAVREVGVYLWEWTAVGESPLEIGGVAARPSPNDEDDYDDPWRALLHPDDLAGFRSEIADALEGPATFSARARLRLGDEVGYRHYVCRGLSERAKDGTLRMAGTLFDIEEGVRAERAAAAYRDRLQLVIRGAHVGVYDWPDTSAEPVNMDPSMIALLGYAPGEVTQTATWWNGLIHPDDREGVAAELAEATRVGRDYDHAYRMRFRDRGYRTVRSLAAVRPAGEHYALTGMILDVEDAYADRRRLRAANAHLERFSDLIAHDLGASFRHVDAFAGILEEDYGQRLDEGARAIVARLQHASANGRRMIDDLLSYARTGTTELDIRSITLCSILEEVRQTLSHDGAADHVTWENELLPRVRADETQMRMLFQNLFSNAIKFTRGTPGAVVRVEGRVRDEAEVEIVVRDNGAGFKAAASERIFEATSRAHDATEFEGTGLGLANVARIVARHGGRISATGAPGQGAAFTVVLPRG